MTTELDEVSRLMQQLDSFHRDVAMQFLRFLVSRANSEEKDRMSRPPSPTHDSEQTKEGGSGEQDSTSKVIETNTDQAMDSVIAFLDKKIADLMIDLQVAKLDLANSLAQKHRTKAQHERRPKKLSRKHQKQASRRDIQSIAIPIAESPALTNEDFQENQIDFDKLRENLLRMQEEIDQMQMRRQNLNFRIALNNASIAILKANSNLSICDRILEVADSILEAYDREEKTLVGKE